MRFEWWDRILFVLVEIAAIFGLFYYGWKLIGGWGIKLRRHGGWLVEPKKVNIFRRLELFLYVLGFLVLSVVVLIVLKKQYD